MKARFGRCRGGVGASVGLAAFCSCLLSPGMVARSLFSFFFGHKLCWVLRGNQSLSCVKSLTVNLIFYVHMSANTLVSGLKLVKMLNEPHPGVCPVTRKICASVCGHTFLGVLTGTTAVVVRNSTEAA